MTFNEWFHQLEGYHLKSERFYEEFDIVRSKEELASTMVLWLEAAFISGKQEADQVLTYLDKELE